MISQPHNQNLDKGIYLHGLLLALWRGKGLILLVTSLSAGLSVGYALSLPNIYRSTALLAPKSGVESGGLSRMASQYGGLASLAGIRLGAMGGEGLSKAALAQEKIRSLAFFERYLYEEVLAELMAVEEWDPVSRQIRYDIKSYVLEGKRWVRDVDFPFQSKPTPQEAHDAFLQLLYISEDKQSGLVSVSIEHQSPDAAARWVKLIVERVSEDLRATDVREAEESIDFLKAQREQTRLVALDEVFAQLIEEQMKTIMLANVSKNYVFDVVDPPVAAEQKPDLKDHQFVFWGRFLGGGLGAIIALFRYYGRNELV